MIQPTIVFYARLDFDVSSKKTQKYIITRAWGDYSPMDKIKGRNGMVSMYLLPKREVQPSNCPPMHLQGKNSLNITGLKDYFLDGKLSGFAYGCKQLVLGGFDKALSVLRHDAVSIG